MPDARTIPHGLPLPRGVPGIAVVRVRPDGSLCGLAAGDARFDRPAPMTPNTIANLYSITKLVTATAVMRLREAGHVDLDRSIGAYLPDVPFGDGAEQTVTVRQLLSHSSGLPDPAPILWIHLNEEPGPGLAQLTRRLMTRHGRLRFAPGTRSSYSSLGYLLLGCLIERVSGSTYEDVVSAGILRPLRMTRTAFAYPPDSVDDVGRGHERAGSATGLIGRFVFRRFVAHRAGPYLEFRPFLVDGAPYGGLVGSAVDVAQFLAAHLGHGSLDGQRILEERSVREMLVPVRGPDGRPLEPARRSRHAGTAGLGWHLGELAGDRYAFHYGGGGGFLNQARIYPDLGEGLAIVANTTSWNVDALAEPEHVTQRSEGA